MGFLAEILMKIKKTAGRKNRLVMSRSEWKAIGKRAGWDDIWRDTKNRIDELEFEGDEERADPEEEAYKMLFPKDRSLAVEESEFAEEANELEREELRSAAANAKAALSEILEAQMERRIPAPASVLAESVLQAAQDYLDLRGVDIAASVSDLEMLAEFLNADTADPDEAVIKGIIKRILATAEERNARSGVAVKIASEDVRVVFTREQWTKIGRLASWIP